MDQNQNHEPNEERIDLQPPHTEPPAASQRGFFVKVLSLLVVIVLAAVMITHSLTSMYMRNLYASELYKKQMQIAILQAALDDVEGGGEDGISKLRFLEALFQRSSYYANEISREDCLNAVLKAYAAATGDAYAEYYTEEEYQAILEANVGQYKGIGVNVLQEALHVDGYDYEVFRILSVFKDAPAEKSGLKSGDRIYAIKADGAFSSIAALGGYTAAMNKIRGEEGTDVELLIFRPSEEGYESLEFCITRGSYVAESVTYTTLESDPSVGIVKISSFDLTTPVQFKEAINALLAKNTEHFVFDVRGNPGGDLQSIKAVLTYFLKEGDLILCSVDKDGKRVQPYYAETMALIGDYASCNVAKREIGMYANLDAVVICDGNTASAAEVFTATMRDYGIAPIVGETTFGKGIMQSIIPLSEASEGTYDGYVKLTTYAYVTKCGEPYHGIGVSPDDGELPLSKEAKEYSIYDLPQALDNQLQAAVAKFDKK